MSLDIKSPLNDALFPRKIRGKTSLRVEYAYKENKNKNKEFLPKRYKTSHTTQKKKQGEIYGEKIGISDPTAEK